VTGRKLPSLDENGFFYRAPRKLEDIALGPNITGVGQTVLHEVE